MKKLILIAFAALATITACSKSDSSNPTPTAPLSKKTILTRNSWKRINAVWGDSISISVTDGNGQVVIVKTTDYYNTLLKSYQQDNLYIWQANGNNIINEGPLTDPSSTPRIAAYSVIRSGIWSWVGSDSTSIQETWVVNGSSQNSIRSKMTFKNDTLYSERPTTITNTNGTVSSTTFKETFLRMP